MIEPLGQGDIRVRPLRIEDALPLHHAVRASIDSLAHWLPWCTPAYSQTDAEDWVAHCLEAWSRRSEFPLGIFKAQGELLGGVGLSQISRVNNQANLGYWVSTRHRGNGVATVAARLTAQFGFAELGFTRIEIVVLPDNLPSQRVAERLGATREGVARNRLIFQGQPTTAILYSLIPGDLESADHSSISKPLRG